MARTVAEELVLTDALGTVEIASRLERALVCRSAVLARATREDIRLDLALSSIANPIVAVISQSLAIPIVIAIFLQFGSFHRIGSINVENHRDEVIKKRRSGAREGNDSTRGKDRRKWSRSHPEDSRGEGPQRIECGQS